MTKFKRNSCKIMHIFYSGIVKKAMAVYTFPKLPTYITVFILFANFPIKVLHSKHCGHSGLKFLKLLRFPLH